MKITFFGFFFVYLYKILKNVNNDTKNIGN